MTDISGIRKILPDSKVTAIAFDPSGYSMNAVILVKISSDLHRNCPNTDGEGGDALIQEDVSGMGFLQRGLAEQWLGSKAKQDWVPRVFLGVQWAWACLGYSRRVFAWALSSVWIRIWDPGDFLWILLSATFWNWNFGYLGRRLLSTQRITLRGVGKVGHTTAGYLDRRLPSIRRIFLRGSMVGHTIGTVLHSPDSVWCLIKCLIASFISLLGFIFDALLHLVLLLLFYILIMLIVGVIGLVILAAVTLLGILARGSCF
ncbi:putative adenosylmethionine decarboxylase [Rosa chinensis]|uniref:Putative adenosylmethionine decarboxylase n=1 Tax=Rosa chinensis TaxID=74649 RepID=A0A2P6QY61_ROSCH|nr:putative adenosylmethionine decarboxylase [Rosa chinensis]